MRTDTASRVIKASPRAIYQAFLDPDAVEFWRPPQGMTADDLREGSQRAYSKFYSLRSMAQRFPLRGSRSRTQWSIYNMFYRRGEVTGRDMPDPIAAPTPAPVHAPNPPLLPVKREWREAVLEGLRESKSA